MKEISEQTKAITASLSGAHPQPLQVTLLCAFPCCSFGHSHQSVQPNRVAPTEKITEKFADLRAFLTSRAVDAASARAVLDKEDIRLKQLPKYSAEKLVRAGLTMGAADRIVDEASKYLPE
jgi:hypothetical protein